MKKSEIWSYIFGTIYSSNSVPKSFKLKAHLKQATIYVPDVWKDLKLEFKEEIPNIKIDIDLSLSEPKGIRNSKNHRTPKTPLPNKRIYPSQLSSTVYNKSIDSSSSSVNYDKRIDLKNNIRIIKFIEKILK